MLINGILGALIAVILLIEVILGSALAQHRIDVPRKAPLWSGPSRSWQVNKLVHAKFDERGRRIKAWVIGLLVTRVVLIAAVIVHFALAG